MSCGTYAIVCTLFVPPNDVEPLHSFLSYHLALGFDRIYLFVDNPLDVDVSKIIEVYGNHVTLFNRGNTLRAEQERVCSLFSSLQELIDSDVPSRQVLNAEYASKLATDEGVQWLLHIDIDEVRRSNLFCVKGVIFVYQLFHLPYPSSLESHFTSIEKAGFESITYINHEGKPLYVPP